jgi:hypothetical protein
LAVITTGAVAIPLLSVMLVAVAVRPKPPPAPMDGVVNVTATPGTARGLP